ncbi:MAG TPA: amidohydrolase/deacetylase family metallohydrolase [Amycolatopsis sp.]|nr:amidohydrolase/deacetylase family metallohydrolase [Amycolatopsis sp.]
MAEHDEVRYDLIVRGGRVIDPANGTDTIADVGVRGDRIAAVAPKLPDRSTTTVVDARGKVVCPGLVDLHTHVYQYVTNFGLDADEAGVHAGVTTVVDMGSVGTWLFPGLKAYIIDTAVTEVLSFLMMGYIGAVQGNRGGPSVLTPDWGDADTLAATQAEFPDLIRGFKTWGESGTTSQWGWRFLEMGAKARDLTGLPLYIHTGELYPVDETNRPDPATIMPEVLAHARPGDVLGHCYSAMPDGILGTAPAPSAALRDAVASGVRLDVGHGINFAFDTARRMLDGGLQPTTISSDVHGSFVAHDDSSCGYSLVGTMSKLLALGMRLPEVIACASWHPAQVLGKDGEIGTLSAGSRADVTVLAVRRDDWRFLDPTGGSLDASERLVPSMVVRAGTPIVPHGRLLRDVLTPAERGEQGAAVAAGGQPR